MPIACRKSSKQNSTSNFYIREITTYKFLCKGFHFLVQKILRLYKLYFRVMAKKAKYSLWLFLHIFNFILSHSIAAQSSIKASFQKDTTVVEEIQNIQKNIYSIATTEQQKINVVFSTVDTDRIVIISSKEIEITLQSNNTLHLPLYYKLLDNPTKEWATIQAYIYNSGSNKLLQKHSFIIHLPKISKWFAGTNQPEYFVFPGKNTQEIILQLNNQGNVNEKIKATILRMQHGKEVTTTWSDSIVLSAKKYISWYVHVPLIDIVQKKEKTSTCVIVMSNEKGVVQKLPISLITPSDIYKETSAPYNGNGIFINTEVSQVWRNKTKQNLFGMNGKIRIDSMAHLDINFKQFYFLQKTYLPTTLASISYKSKKNLIYAGNIIDVTDFFMDGWGARFNHNFSSSTLGLTVAKDRTKDAYLIHGKWKSNLSNNLSLTQQLSSYIDIDNKTQSILPQTQLEWKDSNKTEIKLFIGGSREKVQKIRLDTVMLSSMQGYSFSKRWKHLSIQSSLLHYGKTYAGINGGLDQHEHSITFDQKPFSIRAYYSSNDRNLLYANDSSLYLLQGIATNEIGTSLEWAYYQNICQFVPSIFTQYGNNVTDLRSTIYQIKYNYKWYQNYNSFSISGNIGFNKITQQHTTHAYTHNIMATAQIKGAGLFISWNKGPYFYYEALQFINQSHKLSKFNSTIYKEWNFPKTNFSMRSYIAFISDQLSIKNNFRLSHYMQYSIPNCGVDIKLFAEWNNVFSASNFIQFTINKRWIGKDIKSLFNHTKRITLYKDENGNKMLDNQDPVLKNQPIWIKKQLLITNGKGQVIIRNPNELGYNINLNDIDINDAGTPVNGYQQKINDERSIAIAFQTTERIQGKIRVIKPQYTNGVVTLSGIKINIRNEKDNFIAVSNDDGVFEISVPLGIYNISIDTNTIPGEIIPNNNVQQIGVTQNKTTGVEFILHQRERTIKIKRQ